MACERIVGIPDVSLEPPDAGDAASSGPSATGASDAGACALPNGAARPGPTMVRLDAPQGSYCIDTTEVTVAQFDAYLLDSGTLVDPPAGCSAALAGGTLATLRLVDDNPDDQDLPVDQIGECYAWSYCRWAAKRLCGRVGDGGPVSASDPAESTEWGYACVNGKQNTAYPYGPVYDASACNTEGTGPAPVGSKSGCHGITAPFDRIYDLSGNAWELVNDLTPTNTSADPWGGAWNSRSGASCTPSGAFNGYVFNPEPSGFRCCADVR
jgi:formylglycine-generating enzyme required for sulfatase activity